MNPETAKPATDDTVNGLRKSEQLGRRLDPSHSEPPNPTQGHPTQLQIICILWCLAELVAAAGPR